MMGGKPQMFETGTYTPSEDVYASNVKIPHSLGVVPDFVMVMADTFTSTTDMTVKYIANAFCSKSNLVASNKSRAGFAAYLANRNGRDTFWSVCEDVGHTKFLYDTYFKVPYYNLSDTLKSGITYHYVIGTFN